jgi:hypothetical protein
MHFEPSFLEFNVASLTWRAISVRSSTPAPVALATSSGVSGTGGDGGGGAPPARAPPRGGGETGDAVLSGGDGDSGGAEHLTPPGLVGPGRHCTPSHRMPFNPRRDGSQHVSMTRRAYGLADIARHLVGCH